MTFASGNQLISIYFEHGSPLYTTPNIVDHYFPAILYQAEHQRCIFAQDLADKLYFALRGGFHIRSKNIRAAIRPLFGLIQAQSGGHGMAVKVTNLLSKFLEQDLDLASHSGLTRSRTRFLILAFAAKATQSTQLAGALVSFFYECTPDIMLYEPPELLHEWGAALIEIRDLVMDPEFQTCIHHLARKGHKMTSAYRNPGLQSPRTESFINAVLERGAMYDLDRGRRSHRTMVYEGPRSATMPRMQYPRRRSRPRTPLYLPTADTMALGGLDPMMGIMAPSPLMSPRLLPPLGGPFAAPADEVGMLAVRQDELEDQVRELQMVNGIS